MWRLICAIAVLMLAFAPHAAAQDGRWLRAETDGFVVYGAAPERVVRGIATELESFDGLLRRMTEMRNPRSPTKLHVYLFSENEFQQSFPQYRESIRGLYTARVDQIAAFAIYTDGGGIEAQDILFHEYAHHFMFQYFANAYPAWYVEGFAEFMSTAVLGTERITLGRSDEGRTYTLRNETWMPMERLLTAAPLELNTRDAQLFYAQSWLFQHYLVLTPGKMAQFHGYIRALRLGQEPVAAFQTGFGMTPEEMQSELRRYFRGGPNALALTRPVQVEAPNLRLTHLPASANRLLPLLARVRDGVNEPDRAAVLAQIRQLAGGASDPFATRTLAYAETSIGDIAAARTLLTPYLEANPDDTEALYIMGSSYLREADEAGGSREALLAQGRRYFGRAYRHDPNNVPAMYGYVRSYSGMMMDEASAANYLNILLLANQLAPQIDEISLNAAAALMGHGRHAEAIPMLRAVAFDPHAGSGAGAARQMLQEAEAAVAGGN